MPHGRLFQEEKSRFHPADWVTHLDKRCRRERRKLWAPQSDVSELSSDPCSVTLHKFKAHFVSSAGVKRGEMAKDRGKQREDRGSSD